METEALGWVAFGVLVAAAVGLLVVAVVTGVAILRHRRRSRGNEKSRP